MVSYLSVLRVDPAIRKPYHVLRDVRVECFWFKHQLTLRFLIVAKGKSGCLSREMMLTLYETR